MMPYNPKRAWSEYHFIDLAFVPTGRTDPHECKGGLLDATTAIMHLMEPPHSSPNTLSLHIPPPSQLLTFMVQEKKDTVKEDVSDDDTERRVFCPPEHREPIMKMMEAHLCTHPLIPGYSHPSTAGIHKWAVKQMYQYCVSNDLRELWAYLWENWYHTGRWELWAHLQHPGIPILKTTMIMESQ